MITLEHLKEGYGMLARARSIRRKGFKKYKGSAKKICTQIVNECWNKTYFQTSTGHFKAFYIRDFCIATEGLLKLGYREEIRKTLQYALAIYSLENTIATTIARDRPLHVYEYSPDSLPMLLRSIRIAQAHDILKVYLPFIELQISNYFNEVFDLNTGLISEKKFSSMKDNFTRKSSCYDNCMLAMLKDELEKLDIFNPFTGYDTKEKIKENFWNGKYFYDDLNKKKYVAGDANTFPFWCDIFDEQDMFNSCLKEIQKNNLDKPWPLKYTKKRLQKPMFPLNMLLPDYETNTIWMHLGLCFIESVQKFDKKLADNYLKKYTEVIETNKNFLEIFDSHGKPLIKNLYAADESMIWAAAYLNLYR